MARRFKSTKIDINPSGSQLLDLHVQGKRYGYVERGQGSQTRCLYLRAYCYVLYNLNLKDRNLKFPSLKDLILTLILTCSQSQDFAKNRHLSRSLSASSASMSTKTHPGLAQVPMQLNQPNRHLAYAYVLHTSRFCDLQRLKKKPSYYFRGDNSSIIIILYTILSSEVVTRFFFKRNQAEKI